MQQLEFIPRIEEGDIIPQRSADGYISATALCRSVNKQFSDYRRLKNTQEFLVELSRSTGLPEAQLIHVINNVNSREQGTWVHPLLAINLGQWLSARFAVKVSEWVQEWRSGAAQAVMPVHLQRYMQNMAKIPHTHFSMLNELTLNLIAPLEKAGYTLPQNLVPDISEGRMFCRWLRENRSIEPNEFPMYDHEYLDGRVVQAKLYPIELMGDFKRHFHEVWLPNQAPKYFGQRSPEALGYIAQALLPGR